MFVLSNQRGFTLIELMLALAISAILIAVSYPIYTDYQAHAERDRAIVALMQLSARLENYFSDNGSYVDATIHNCHAVHLMDGLHYRLKITSATDSSYEIQAVPFGIQKTRDTHCGALILTDTNVRGISGDGDVAQCWM